MDIFSSRVNDKICDCCDGSDEWGTDASCPNTCEEMGRKAIEEAQRLKELHEQGHKKKLEYSTQGKKKSEESRTTLSQKEAELEAIKSELETLTAAKDAAEEPEREAKDSHRKKWEEEKAAQKEIDRRADAQFGFDELDTNSDGYVTFEELQTRYELDDDGDGDISEEEALSYLNNQRSVDFETFYSSCWDGIVDKCQFERPVAPSIQPSTATEDDEQKDKNIDEGEGDEDEDWDDDESDDSDDEQDDDDNEEMPDYDDTTKELIAAADAARAAHREVDTKRGNIEREIGELRKYLDISYGVDGEFSPLYDQCYEYTDREYTYKMCAFKKVTQKPKNGGRETNLGMWGKWNGPPENLYSVMRYEGGEKCWNGPERSATITIVCGHEDKLLSASEPNKCEYAMEFSTPAVCEPVKHTIHEEL